MDDEHEIGAYYDRGEEQRRLGDWGRLEFLRTRELLARFLPAPPAIVLDVGGAAGLASDMRRGSSFLGAHGETGQCFARTVFVGCRQGRRDAPQITRP